MRKDGTLIAEAPEKRDIRREQLWRTMRILREFTVGELALHASTEVCSLDEGTARTYCRYLYKAGFLARRKRPRPASVLPVVSEVTYLFLAGSYPGPQPPVVQCLRQVFDPNNNRIVWVSGAGDEPD